MHQDEKPEIRKQNRAGDDFSLKTFLAVLTSAALIAVFAAGCSYQGTDQASSGTTPASVSGQQKAGGSSAQTSAGNKAGGSTGSGADINSSAQDIEKMLGQIAEDTSNFSVEGSRSTQANQLASQLNSMLNDQTDDLTSLN